MRIWWCEAHKQSGNQWCDIGWASSGGSRCRMVPMRLIAEDALVIEKEDGEWPDWALTPMRGAYMGVPILNALDAAQPGSLDALR